MGEGREYQHDFSEIHPKTVFDELGRLQKARKTVAVILDALRQAGIDPRETRLLDIGCSTGILTRHYAEFFGKVVGIDIDDGAVEWARQNRAADNVSYQVGDSMDVPFLTGEFDLVTCTHIYEHVPDAQRMLDEINRVLRPGGMCFFAAENRLRVWDGHYNLPLVTVLPRPLANLYVRVTGRGQRRYETHRTLWGLKRLVRAFEITDYTRAVVRDPEKFEANDMIWPGSPKQKAANTILRVAYWAFPTYLWILRKPADGDQRNT
jgi:ubiquinone/menaquinone biosynthesis C-methylase UbiE